MLPAPTITAVEPLVDTLKIITKTIVLFDAVSLAASGETMPAIHYAKHKEYL